MTLQAAIKKSVKKKSTGRFWRESWNHETQGWLEVDVDEQEGGIDLYSSEIVVCIPKNGRVVKHYAEEGWGLFSMGWVLAKDWVVEEED